MDRFRRPFLFFALLLLVAAVGLPLPVPAAHAQTGELRAFWVECLDDGIHNPAEVKQLIMDAHAANANALFVQVRQRGESYYNESLEPRANNPDLAPLPFDPLAAVIEAAHNATPPLQVHAWVIVFHVGSRRYASSDPAHHVQSRHGCNPSCRWEDPENWISYGYDGANLFPSSFVDPGHPEAANYTVDVLVDLVRHYELDGLHLDYIRYEEDWGGVYYGYNKTNVDRFNAAYGRIGLPDPWDEDWKAWRRDQVTAVMRQIYLEALAVRPGLVVSVAAITWGDGPQAQGWENTAAYKRVFQDWRAWLEEGILDLAVPMNYFQDDLAYQQIWYERWLEWEKDHQYNRGVVPGPGPFLNHVAGSVRQIHLALAPSEAGSRPVGVSLYSYGVTNVDEWPNRTFYSSLAWPGGVPLVSRTLPGGRSLDRAIAATWRAAGGGTPPFANWVAPPRLPWKNSPTTGHLMGWALGSERVLDGAEVTLRGPVERTVWTDGSGFFGAVDLPPGAYTAEAPAAGPAYSLFRGDVRAGEVTLLRPAAGPVGVQITGRARLLPHQVATFHALVQPSGADVATHYLWDNGVEGDAAQYSWPRIGSYLVRVTASHPYGQAEGVFAVQVLGAWSNQTLTPLSRHSYAH